MALLLYVVVALLNYSVVQSLAGSAASSYFSKEWGGKAKIGSISANIFDHVVLHDILLIDPQGDTIADAGRISVSFNKLPYKDGVLDLDRVGLRDVYFHLVTDSNGINLKYITDYFKSDKPSSETHEPFTVKVRRLRMREVHYKMDLRVDKPHVFRYENGVDVQRMEFSHLNAVIRNIRVCNDHITCKIESFSGEERSGFKFNKICGNAYVSNHGISATNFHVATDSTDLTIDALLNYRSWKTMSHYVDSVDMTVKFHPGSVGCFVDAAYWAPTLWGMDERVLIEGDVHGPVAAMYAENMLVRFGRGTELHVDGSVIGLPYIDSTYFDGVIHQFTTNYSDICSVKLPTRAKALQLPSLLKNLGSFNLQASMLGRIKDFDATATLNSAVGQINVEGSMLYNETRKTYTYTADASSEHIDIARLLPNKVLYQSGLNVHAEGSGFNPNEMNASATIGLNNTILAGGTVDNTMLEAEIKNGQIVANANINDEQNNLNLRCRLRNDSALVALNIKNLDLAMVGMKPNANGTTPQVRSNIDIAMALPESKNIEEATGTVEVSALRYSVGEREVSLDSVNIAMDLDDGMRIIHVGSDVAKVDAEGYFDFSDFGLIVRQFINNYCPTYYNPNAKALSDEELASIADATLSFSAEWKDRRDKLAPILPNIRIAPGTRLMGAYNNAESLKLIARSDSLKVGGLAIAGLAVNGHSIGERYKADIEADAIAMGATELLSNATIGITAHSSEVGLNLNWNDHSDPISKGSLAMLMESDTSGNRVSLLSNNILIKGNPWDVAFSEPITLAKKHLHMEGLSISSQGQEIKASACIMQQPNDSIGLDIHNFALNQINFLLGSTGFNLDGLVNGTVMMTNISETPYVDIKTTVDDCMINEQPLGDANIQSQWDAELQRLNLEFTTLLQTDTLEQQPLVALGYVDLGTPDKDLEFNIDFDGFSLRSIAPLLQSFSSQLEGNLHGNFVVSGSAKMPQLRGDAYIEKASLLVDATGVTYTIDDTISFTNNEILFDNITILDPQKNQALLNGRIRHSHWKDFQIDLALNTRHIMMMNTTAQNANYYGRIFGAADGTITGTLNALDIKVNAQTRPGSSLTFAVDNKKQVKELGYIMFEDFEANEEREERERNNSALKESGMNYKITADIVITPDLRLTVPMDFGQMYADAAAVANGDLHFETGSATRTTLTGDCEIASGTMGLSLLGLINKDFSISEGSSINFPGSISDATFNVEAIYQQRVNMATLTGADVSSEIGSKNIPVQDVIILSGNISNPSINFDIRLPNVDPSVEEEVFSYIDRSNELDMLNQTLSLLIMNQFYNNTTSSAAGATANGLSAGYSVLANSLGSVVTNMVQFVDVNFNYKSANGLQNEQYNVDISRSWDKFYFESTLGFGTDERKIDGNDNGFTGDVLVGYKMNPQLHLFVFNRSNTNDYTRADLPYKQGLGLKFTKDFDRWRDLFKKKKNR